MKLGGKGGDVAAKEGQKWEAITTELLLQDLAHEGFEITEGKYYPKAGPKRLEMSCSAKNCELELYFRKSFGNDFAAKHGLQSPSKKWLEPDVFVVNLAIQKAFVIEKKQQTQTGSVDEKLVTCDFKQLYYETVCEPLGLDIVLFWQLSEWFGLEKNHYSFVFDYMQEKRSHIVISPKFPVKVFWSA
jgi:hypothetical protein